MDLGVYDCTAYYLFDGSCGYTYTGTVPQEGRTIATDPSYIPLGTEVYIEGIGFRKAEDTGVKGQTIDIFFDSYAKCVEWGNRPLHVYEMRLNNV